MPIVPVFALNQPAEFFEISSNETAPFPSLFSINCFNKLFQ